MTISAPAPLSGVRASPTRPFGIYVHVPFCATRCGYCDFNTYTPAELGGANPDGWLEALRVELELAATTLGCPPEVSPGSLRSCPPEVSPGSLRSCPPEVSTVFVGGGTPSMLGGPRLAAVLDAIRANFGLAPDAEITTEANPESTSRSLLAELRAAGYTRVSLGMQSAAPHVLAALDRVHSPGRALTAAAEARAEGFEHVNLDLIYGTPGETDDDLARSADAVIGAGVDHVSAYALVVEDGTALARRVRRGELPMPDDDDLADKYVLVDEAMSAHGLEWYEVSNWARDDAARCRHNNLYWTGADWWGIGPGAHSHVNGVRWWNVKHPAAYAARLADGASPAHAREILDLETRRVERVLLELRLREGLATDVLDAAGRHAVQDLVDRDLLVRHPDGLMDRLVLTRDGRLLADAVVRDLLP